MKKKQTICLVSPGHLSTNPRLVKEATALNNAGFNVRIVCGQYSRMANKLDKSIATECWDITRVRWGRFESDPVTHLRQKLTQLIASSFFRAGITTADVADFAHAVATADLSRAVCASPRADLYIAHYVAALPAAARAAKKFDALFAFDAEDYHLGDLSDDPENDHAKSLIRSIESRYLPSASYVSAASPLIGLKYKETYGITCPTTILNVFPRPELPNSIEPLERGPSMYWFSQTIGPDRGLELAVEAVAMSRSRPHFFIRGNPVDGYAEHLQQMAASVGIEGHLHFLPLCEPNQLERMGAAFDIGFVGEQSHTLNRQIALTNKLFSYITSGIPIVASDIPAHQEISQRFAHAMKLFNSASPRSLADCIDGYLLNPKALLEAKARACSLAQSVFNWELEEQKLIDVVQSTLVGSGRGDGFGGS